jgi:uncharacterized protein
LAPWRTADDGVIVALRVTPRGGRDAIDGVETMSDGRAVLKLRVRAAPADGEANAAVVQLLAAALKLRRTDVEVMSGTTARVKQVVLRGDAAALMARLAALAGDGKT